jgi:hypothetical protein
MKTTTQNSFVSVHIAREEHESASDRYISSITFPASLITNRERDMRAKRRAALQEKIEPEHPEEEAFEYSRTASVEFCQRIYKTLPCELRELIYGELTGTHNFERVYDPIYADIRNPHRNGTMVALYPYQSYFDPCLSQWTFAEHRRYRKELDLSAKPVPVGAQHFWFRMYTGEIADRELAAYWYRTRTFIFYSDNDRTPLSKFLFTDVHGKRTGRDCPTHQGHSSRNISLWIRRNPADLLGDRTHNT